MSANIKFHMKTLDVAEKNRLYKIVDFSGEVDDVKRRLWELGFSRGQSVRVVEKSLLKKVSLIEIRGYLLSVRTALLSCVVVQ